jgi:hypothetical protein
MQGTVVAMLMILAGLGSSNKDNDGIEPSPGYSDSATRGETAPVAPAAEAPSTPGPDGAAGFVQPVAPPGYAPYPAGPSHNGYHPSGTSIAHVFYETLYSFCHGHDDDVMTAKEIEAAFYSGAYSGLNDYSPAAVLSPDAPR